MTPACCATLTGLPVLETERLILRAPRAGDWPAFRDYRASPRTTYTGGTKKEHEAAEQFASFFGHWIMRGFGRLIAEDRAAHRPIGHFGPLQLVDAQLPELTWSLWSREAEGKGYAYEAACAINHWLFATLGWPEAKAEIHADNHASHRLARKLGGQVWPDCPYQWMERATVYRFGGRPA